MDAALLDSVLGRLTSDDSVDDATADLVLAACEGDAELAEAIRRPSGMVRDRTASGPPPASEPAGAYLTSITVEGFRGVGPPSTLELSPGPGLTLVVGRNGSGKSSFAEAFEYLLTGANARWEGRSKVWEEGWRNLHHDTAAITATLAEQGRGGPTSIVAQWENEASLDEANVTVHRPGEEPGSLAALGWTAPLAMWRPFLSYNELGSMLDEGPSKLYDSLARILGLDDLVDAQDRLRKERLSVEKLGKNSSAAAKALASKLADVDDERAVRTRALLGSRTPDLDELETLAVGEADVAEEGELSVLRQLASLAPPRPDEVAAAAQNLRETSAAAAETAGTDAGRALQVAELLEAALVHHADHGDGPCPVCGASRLDDAWRARTEDEAKRLRAEATHARAAQQRAEAARRGLLGLVSRVPAVLDHGAGLGIDTDGLRSAWERFAAVPEEAGSEALAAHVEGGARAVAEEARLVVARAREMLERRQDRWRPLAAELATWVGEARSAAVAGERLAPLKSAEAWLKRMTAGLRDERFAPIAEASITVWSRLRQQSNVDLAGVALAGDATRRRVELHVTVDGRDGAALGVMSQGELHALALSLFIPRATMAESPFRFVVIDDPVQAMDPARVDGLARVLAGVAHTRQVIVFTHDDRLPEAVRLLQLPARIIELTRRADSVVELREALTPARRAIDDALALALTAESGDLPVDVVRRVVPGFCRLAVEAACAEVYRRRRLSAGADHQEVERALEAADTMRSRLKLALFDDAQSTQGIKAEIARRFSPSKADLYDRLNEGAHQGLDNAEAKKFVRNVEALVEGLIALP